jgi:hypothetical protein
MGNGALAIGLKLPRPSSTLPLTDMQGWPAARRFRDGIVIYSLNEG